jgi:hypothetical protein
MTRGFEATLKRFGLTFGALMILAFFEAEQHRLAYHRDRHWYAASENDNAKLSDGEEESCTILALCCTYQPRL